MKVQDKFTERLNNTLDSFDTLLEFMQEYIIKESVRDELFRWVGLLMHLENERLLNKDAYDLEVAAAACAYALDNPCQGESDKEIVKAVCDIRNQVIQKSEEIGIGSEITPKTILHSMGNGKLCQLMDYIRELAVDL